MSCMTPDDFQRIWQTQEGLSIDSEKLAAALRQHDQFFNRIIYLRDAREIGVALVMIPVWIGLGIATSSPWTWWLEIPALLWVAGFMFVDRRRQQRGAPGPGSPLHAGLQHSVEQVEHQIWLLRNILWWYLLPLGLPLALFFLQISFGSTGQTDAPTWVNILTATLSASIFLSFLVAIYGFIYWLNQYAVRKQLDPLRQQLQAALGGLAADSSPTTSDRPNADSHRRMLVCACCFLAIEVLMAGFLVLVFGFAGDGAIWVRGPSRDGDGYPRRSPFEAVRWIDAQVEVQVGQKWGRLVSLNGLPATEIVAFSRETYGEKWQKRFEEDLIELLTRMGHPPGDTVTLIVQLPSGESQALIDVPMTEANRDRIRAAAQAREEAVP